MAEKESGANARSEQEIEPTFRVDDRRHWAHPEEEPEAEAGVEPGRPTLIDEYRQRAEQAESKLQEYIEAFKQFKDEQEQFRARMRDDIDRRVELRFGELVTALLGAVDDLELALSHVRQVPEASPLAEGVELVRDRFLKSLEQQGVERFVLDGEKFDPNEAEALRVDSVASPEEDQRVTETLRPGYRLGQRVIRAARVAVGRHG